MAVVRLKKPAAARKPPAPRKRKGVSVSSLALARARAEGKRRAAGANPFKLPEFPKQVLKEVERELLLANDGDVGDVFAWATNNLSSTIIESVFAEGVQFLGYAALAVLAQRPEYRVISECLATEMTREWIEVKSVSDDEDKTDKITKLNDAIKRHNLQEVFRKCALLDGFFGRSHLYIDTGETDEKDELKLSLGDGADVTSRAKFKQAEYEEEEDDEAEDKEGQDDEPKKPQRKLKGFIPIEPVWCYPTHYNSTNPLKPDWYRPETWHVMGNELHRTRLLTFIGREVPDMLKPAYSFGGLSMSQMAKPYIDNWLKTRQSVADIISAFSVFILKTNLGASLTEGGDEVFKRAEFFNLLRDNRGLMMVDKDSEDFTNVSAPLGSLDALQAQTQEHMASVSRIPVVKLLGIQPSGLNASSEGEIRTFYDWIKAFQEYLFRTHLTTCINFIQLDEFGEVDPDITFDFKDLWQLDEAGKAAIQQTKSATIETDIASGVISPEEGRLARAKDPDSPYAGLDLDKTPPPQQEEEGLEGLLGGENDNESEASNNLEEEEEPQQSRPKLQAHPGGGLGKRVTNRAAQYGGITTGGFKGDLGLDAAKFRKSDVSFEHPAQGKDHCWECKHFLDPGCALVCGKVLAEDWCREFEQQHEDEWADEQFTLAEDEFNEADHPRDENGKFSSSGGSKAAEKPKAEKDQVWRYYSDAPADGKLNGVTLKSWKPPKDWSKVSGQKKLDEPPPPEADEDYSVSAGTIIKEPDGRVWLMRPTEGYGGYDYTFPKGGQEEGLSLQATAIKETWEETGLKVRITGFADDAYGDTSITRYYFAERESGTPSDHGDEAEAVYLVPPARLYDFLNRTRDRKLAKRYLGAEDEVPFKEEQHPRDRSGKFTKGKGSGKAYKATPQKDIVSALKSHGYNKSKQLTPGGHHKFEHPSGNHIYVGASKPGQTWLTGWRPGGEGQFGHGAKSLKKHLESVHGKAGEVLPPEKEFKSGLLEKGQQPGPKHDFGVVLPPGAQAKYVNGGKSEFGDLTNTYALSDGGSLTVYADNSWSLDVPGTKGAMGSGQQELNQEWNKLSSGEGPATFPFVIPKGQGNFIASKSEYETGGGTKVQKFGLKDGSTLRINQNGYWALYDKNGDFKSEGASQESLNAAFEALHPRGAGGKFIKKPEVLPTTTKEAKADLIEQGFTLDYEGKHGDSLSKGGIHVSIYPDGAWAVLNKGTLEKLGSGSGTSGFSGLYSTLAKQSGGEQVPEPDVSKPQFTTPLMTETLGNEGFKHEKTGSSWDKFTNEAGARIYIKGDGSWTYHSHDATPGQSTTMKSGTGLTALKDALAGKSAAAPKQAVSKTLNFSGMKQIGPQLGSNPGGQYEDAEGNKYYVKQPQDNDHAKNEILAAALYAAAGGNTLTYHQMVDGDKLYVATDLKTLDKNNISQLSPAEKKQAQKDFALHAWLANWDAAGTGGDNVGVVDGKVTPLDFGGSLLYRAQGAPKGGAFDTQVTEWENLRNPNKNPYAAKLYGDMTPEQLKQSADQLKQITNTRIRDLARQYGPGDAYAKDGLADKLIVRRDAIIKKADAEANKPPPVANPGELCAKIASWNPASKPAHAIADYKGSGYIEMNNLMRYFAVDSDDSNAAQGVKSITDWLDKASSKEDVVLYRGVRQGEYAAILKTTAKAGRSTHEYGFSSMATSKDFSRSWAGSGGVLYTIKVPKGSKIGTVRGENQQDSEYEVLAQRGTRFKITNVIGFQGRSGVYEIEVELDQSHLGKEF